MKPPPMQPVTTEELLQLREAIWELWRRAKDQSQSSVYERLWVVLDPIHEAAKSTALSEVEARRRRAPEQTGEAKEGSNGE